MNDNTCQQPLVRRLTETGFPAAGQGRAGQGRADEPVAGFGQVVGTGRPAWSCAHDAHVHDALLLLRPPFNDYQLINNNNIYINIYNIYNKA
jgi:hypothetical protein